MAQLKAPGLLLLGVLGSCRTAPPEDSHRQPPPQGFDACGVVVGPMTAGTTAPAPEAADPSTRGPWGSWTSHPDLLCDRNLHLPGGTAVHLTWPTATDPVVSGEALIPDEPLPVVVFAHANSYSSCSLFESYPSLFEHWASWGFVVVSIDMADLCTKNSHDNLAAREARVRATVEALSAWQSDGQLPEGLALDPQRVAVAGHSRGGSAALIHGADPAPGVQALLALQPVDPDRFGFGSPPIALPTLVLAADGDRDVRFPAVEPVEATLAGPYTFATLMGGVHAWTADTIKLREDDAPQLDHATQLRATASLTTAFLQTWLGGAEPLSVDVNAPDLEARLAALLGQDLLAVRGRPPRSSRLLIDDFELPAHGGDGDPWRNELGGLHEVRDLLGGERQAWRGVKKADRPYWSKGRVLELSAGQVEGRWSTPVGANLPPGVVLRVSLRAPDSAAVPGKVSVVLTEDGTTRSVDLVPLLSARGLHQRMSSVELPLRLAPGATSVQLSEVGLAVLDGLVQVDAIELLLPAAVCCQTTL